MTGASRPVWYYFVSCFGIAAPVALMRYRRSCVFVCRRRRQSGVADISSVEGEGGGHEKPKGEGGVAVRMGILPECRWTICPPCLLTTHVFPLGKGAPLSEVSIPLPASAFANLVTLVCAGAGSSGGKLVRHRHATVAIKVSLLFVRCKSATKVQSSLHLPCVCTSEKLFVAPFSPCRSRTGATNLSHVARLRQNDSFQCALLCFCPVQADKADMSDSEEEGDNGTSPHSDAGYEANINQEMCEEAGEEEVRFLSILFPHCPAFRLGSDGRRSHYRCFHFVAPLVATSIAWPHRS